MSPKKPWTIDRIARGNDLVVLLIILTVNAIVMGGVLVAVKVLVY